MRVDEHRSLMFVYLFVCLFVLFIYYIIPMVRSTIKSTRPPPSARPGRDTILNLKEL